jgi:DNA ligase D-like protein (predicted 3'-phosphoesterase)
MKVTTNNRDSNSRLASYHRKRDFRRTPEPAGDTKKRTAAPIFVIQKHDATRLHYDFRLQAGDVLKSWAVPKGPSTDPAMKRLAIPTEDHPLEYADFEGVIPEGQYGAGPVIVWDAGTFKNLTAKDGKEVPLQKAVQDGHLKVWLEGKKLRGGYALTRVGRGNLWLLVKMKDSEADPARDPVREEPASVLSGLTIEQMARGNRRRAAS